MIIRYILDDNMELAEALSPNCMFEATKTFRSVTLRFELYDTLINGLELEEDLGLVAV